MVVWIVVIAFVSVRFNECISFYVNWIDFDFMKTTNLYILIYGMNEEISLDTRPNDTTTHKKLDRRHNHHSYH